MKLIANNIALKRGDELIFNDISFALSKGESLIISGPNGVGKSTLLRSLAGFLPFCKGTFDIHANDANADEAKPLYEYCHYINHQNAMKCELTVLENLKFWQTFMGKQIGSLSLYDALASLGLAHTLDLPFGFLSQGQRRRIALAKLFISYRPVWLLDEPTIALDNSSCENFINMTNNYLLSGGIVIAATHLPLEFKQSGILKMTRPLLACYKDLEDSDFT